MTEDETWNTGIHRTLMLYPVPKTALSDDKDGNVLLRFPEFHLWDGMFSYNHAETPEIVVAIPKRLGTFDLLGEPVTYPTDDFGACRFIYWRTQTKCACVRLDAWHRYQTRFPYRNGNGQIAYDDERVSGQDIAFCYSRWFQLWAPDGCWKE